MIPSRSCQLFAALFVGIVSFASAQTTPSCVPNIATATVHAEGLAERIGDINISCSGGTVGATIVPTFFFTFNTNITNKQDPNTGLPNINFATPQPGNVSVVGLRLTSATTIQLTVNYLVPAAGAGVSFALQGIRSAPAMLANGTGNPLVSVSIIGVGVTMSGTGGAIIAAAGFPSLLSSTLNYGVPCNGSPLPSTLDFQTFATSTNFSTVRVTEASTAAFLPRDNSSASGADNGVRIVVRLSGFPANARIFAPDMIVGTDGNVPTSAGAYGTTIAGGTYTPGLSQLLFSRVNGADTNGAGGSPASIAPGSQTSFTSVSEIALSGGSATLVYEVLDSNPIAKENAQIPVFVVVPQTACGVPPPAPTYNVLLGPSSNVSVATSTDPVPRFLPTTIASDCQQIGDCAAAYFPSLMVDQTPIQITGSSQGGTRTGAIQVTNQGGGTMPFTVSITFQPGSNWLRATPTSGQNFTAVTLVADPSQLSAGTYAATVTIDAGQAGKAVVPVNFVVGPPGVKITGVVNAASFKSGLVAPGSFAAIFGTNLGGTNVGVTFNGFPATVLFASASQINVIVPAALGNAPAADVVVTADAAKSDSFKVTVQPNAPGIFNPGIINFADGSINDFAHPAKRGDFILVFATGLAIPLTGQVSVTIGNQSNLVPPFAGAQGSFQGLDQINIPVPAILPASPNPVPLSFCVPDSLGTPVCSNTVNLYIK